MIKKEYFYLKYPKDNTVNLEVIKSTLDEINQIPKDSASAILFFKSSTDSRFACFENPLPEIRNVIPLVYDSKLKEFKIKESAVFSKNLSIFPLLTNINVVPNFFPPPPSPAQDTKLKVHSFPIGYGVKMDLLKDSSTSHSILPLISHSQSSAERSYFADFFPINTEEEEEDSNDDGDDEDSNKISSQNRKKKEKRRKGNMNGNENKLEKKKKRKKEKKTENVENQVFESEMKVGEKKKRKREFDDRNELTDKKKKKKLKMENE